MENWSYVEELDLLMYTLEEFERVSKRPLVKEMIADALTLHQRMSRFVIDTIIKKWLCRHHSP